MEYVQEKMNAKAIQELPLEIVLLGLEFVAFTSKVKIHKTKHVMSENNTKCIFYRVDSCGSTVSQNITYIQNADFPTGTTTASQTCQYTIAGNEGNYLSRLYY